MRKDKRFEPAESVRNDRSISLCNFLQDEFHLCPMRHLLFITHAVSVDIWEWRVSSGIPQGRGEGSCGADTGSQIGWNTLQAVHKFQRAPILLLAKAWRR